MLWVRRSHALLALSFIIFLIFLGSYKQYGIVLIPLGPKLWPYSSLIVSHASSITFLLTTSNIVLHLQQQKPSSTAFGTWRLWMPIFLALRDWYLSSSVMCWALQAEPKNIFSCCHLNKAWWHQGKVKIRTPHCFFDHVYVQVGVPCLLVPTLAFYKVHHPTFYGRVGWQSCNVPMRC